MSWCFPKGWAGQRKPCWEHWAVGEPFLLLLGTSCRAGELATSQVAWILRTCHSFTNLLFEGLNVFTGIGMIYDY